MPYRKLKLYPKNADIYFSQGVAYKNLYNYDEKAIRNFYQAGLLYLEENNGAKSLECVDLMKSINPSSILIKYLEALIFLKQNNRAEALECVDLIKKADPISPLIKKLMDKIYVEDKPKKSKN